VAELNARQILDNTSEVHSVDGDRMVISVGPHHPSTHGVLRLVLELDGETVIKCEPEIGFLHTGIEKTAEYLTWQQANTVVDRMDYLSPISNNLGYCLAVEKLMHIEAPPRAAVVRVILAELQRIASHMAWLGTHGLDLGAQSIFFYAFDLREGILDILEQVAGQRMNPSYFRIGGLAQDVPTNFVDIVNELIARFPQRMKELRALLDTNPIFMDRTRRVGCISPETAVALGVTGANLRATGVNYDVRKAFPYSGYEKYDFAVPLGEHGDVYDRYLVRMREMEESAKIVRQAVGSLPDGDWQINDRKISRPPKAEVRENMEALIHH
jgi:NADH-quinone oxidoreductase subunit D